MPKQITELQKVRKRRASLQLEIDLWGVCNNHFRRKPTKCEARLDRLDTVDVLSSMISRLIAEQQGYV